MNLSQTKVGDHVAVSELSPKNAGEELITRRLLELGFVPGTEVVTMHRAPLSGNPMSYLVRGMHIALRAEEARLIDVKAVL